MLSTHTKYLFSRLSWPATVLSGLAVALFAGGCATPLQTSETHTSYRLGSVPAEDVALADKKLKQGNGRYFWDDQAASAGGSTKIVVNLPTQRVFYYKGGRLVASTEVSTGKGSHPTPSGTYTALSKHPEHRSNLYGKIVDANGNVVKSQADSRKDPVPPGGKFVGASMPNFLRLRHTGRGITSIGFHEGILPGYPASHGCMRLPQLPSEKFMRHTPIGAPVYVENAQPAVNESPATYIVELTEEQAIAKRNKEKAEKKLRQRESEDDEPEATGVQRETVSADQAGTVYRTSS